MEIDVDQPLKLFYYCAPQDRDACNELDRHLTMMKRRGEITISSNFDIPAGSNKQQEIEKRLEQSDIALLFVSSHLTETDDSYHFLLQILDLSTKGLLYVIPIMLNSTDIKGTSIDKLQSLPTGHKTIADFGWDNRDVAFWDVKEGIDKIVQELLTHRKVKAVKKNNEQDLDPWEIGHCDRKEIEKLFASQSDPQKIFAYIISQEPTMYDPLDQQSTNNWSQGNRGPYHFFFAENAYHIKMAIENSFVVGYANIPDFDNLAFQVKMTISSGGGGMILRANTIDPTGYRFFFGCEGLDICNGKYFGMPGDDIAGRIFADSKIQAELSRTYTLTAMAYGSNFLFFVDDQCIARTNDGFLTFGKLGLMAVSFIQYAHVLFREARVWNLSGKQPH